MEVKKIALLFSAGKESLLSLHLLRKQNPDAQIKLIWFAYGQKASLNEEGSLHYYANFYKATKLILRTNLLTIPEGIKTGIGESEVINRNMFFISTAINKCISEGINELVVPFTKPVKTQVMEDSLITFLDAVSTPVKMLYPGFKMYSNLSCDMHHTHLRLLEEGVNVRFIWSCFNSSSEWVHCGKCSKCHNFNDLKNTKEFKKHVKYESSI